MTNRRRLLLALSVSALAPLYARAQHDLKMWRIGILMSGTSASTRYLDALMPGLAKLGYDEGTNVMFMTRFADGDVDRLSTIAAELVAKKPDVIVTNNTPATRAAKQATTSIPIVFTNVGDPVGNDFAASLAKPGRNITGLSIVAADLAGKRLQMLHELAPKASRVAIIRASAQPTQVAEAERAAKVLGMQTLVIDLNRRNELAKVATRLKAWRTDAIDILDGATAVISRDLHIELAATLRLPAITGNIVNVDAGTLIGYGVNYADNVFRAATYVDKILKGTKPGDIPVELPTKFELIVNLKTAKALDIKIPQTLLQRADRVIE